jgi:hypothetical protein
VAVHKGETSAVDSIQLQKNIEELVNRANLQVVEDDMLPEEAPLLSPSDSAAAQHSVPVKTDPNPAGPKPVSKPVKRMSNEEAISRKQ